MTVTLPALLSFNLDNREICLVVNPLFPFYGAVIGSILPGPANNFLMRRIRAKCIQLLIYSVLLSGLLGAVLWHSAAAQTTGPSTASIAPFPRTYQLSNGGSVTLFEPQVASWAGQTHMAVWCAVSYQAKAGEVLVVGSIKIEADTEIALSEQLVRFKEFSIPEVNLSSLSRDD